MDQGILWRRWESRVGERDVCWGWSREQLERSRMRRCGSQGAESGECNHSEYLADFDDHHCCKCSQSELTAPCTRRFCHLCAAVINGSFCRSGSRSRLPRAKSLDSLFSYYPTTQEIAICFLERCSLSIQEHGIWYL